MSNQTKLILGGLITVIVLYLVFAFDIPYRDNSDDFVTCVAMGNPVMESYPRQCRGKNGILFVEKIAEKIKEASSTDIIINSL